MLSHCAAAAFLPFLLIVIPPRSRNTSFGYWEMNGPVELAPKFDIFDPYRTLVACRQSGH
jgi:hypothetical protein